MNAAGVTPRDPSKLPKPRKPVVTRQPRTYREILHGTDVIANAVRPTLGPLPRLVVMEALRRTDVPEFLDDAATIGRRIFEIQPRGCDVGAMLLRQALWRMHQEAGDGAATMAVMYQTLLREGIRYVTQFDCNAMRLRNGLERGLRVLTDALCGAATPLLGRQAIADMAMGMCQGDHEMAQLLGEIFDMVGPDGLIVVEGYEKMGLEREYVEGTYWKLSGWISRALLSSSAEKRETFEDAALLITDFELREPRALVPVLERCLKAGVKRLILIAKEVSDSVIGLLVNNNRANTIQTLAVRTPKVAEMDRVASMEDIAMLTGGRVFYAAAYKGLPAWDGADFRVEDLGHARRAWATDSLFGIYGGKGNPRRIRQHIAHVSNMLRLAQDEHARKELQTRLGRLNGGTVILRVGAIHETAREHRKAVANRSVTTLRHALTGGVVPGGGVALLNAQAALADLPAADEDAAFAYKMLSRMLEEPLRAIVRNAGYMPDIVVEKVKAAPAGYGFDVRTGQIVAMRECGVVDALTVLTKALQVAVCGAASALTTDVIIHHKRPIESIEP
jgi:chaperonin GroEL